MSTPAKKGIWATMITPFTEDDKIDFAAVEKMLEWYDRASIDGIFSLCYSSEILRLTSKEKNELFSFIFKNMPKGMGLAASGHSATDSVAQLDDLKALRDLGAPILVLVGNRLAAQDEDDNVLLERAYHIMKEIPDVPLGLYECPYPYKRSFSPQLLGTLAKTGRFVFMKETSCHMDEIQAKLEATKDTPFGLYNANSATLLSSLKAGAAGFCGIMCNFHPDLYAEMYQAFLNGNDALARKIQALLGVLSVYEHQYYPVNAKAYLKQEGLGFTERSRLQDCAGLTYGMRVELDEMRELTEIARELIRKEKAAG